MKLSSIKDLASGADSTAQLPGKSTGELDFRKRYRRNGSTFSETIQTVPEPNQRRLSRQLPQSSSSNCSKLELHAPEREGDEMSEENEKWMKLSDVAAEAQMALSTVYYLHKTGKGPNFSRLGRNIRVKRSDFDEWFESNREN